jgi:type IV pilus biogenesis protein CpaD/CtpE
MHLRTAGSGAAIVMALLVSGCQLTTPGLRDVAAPQLGIATETRTYDIPAGSCVQVKRAVGRFVEAAADGRPESLRIFVEVPRSQPCRLPIASALADAGVPRSHMRMVTGQGASASDQVVRIRADRVVATHADCYVSDASNTISANDNGFDPALGCSTLANIGGMVADPEDLRIGRGRVKAEGEPAASAVAAERQRQDVKPAPPAAPPDQHVKTTAAP